MRYHKNTVSWCYLKTFRNGITLVLSKYAIKLYTHLNNHLIKYLYILDISNSKFYTFYTQKYFLYSISYLIHSMKNLTVFFSSIITFAMNQCVFAQNQYNSVTRPTPHTPPLAVFPSQPRMRNIHYYCQLHYYKNNKTL